MKENTQEIVKNDLKISSVDILNYMQDFAAAHNFDLYTLPQIQYNAVCRAVGMNFFNENTGILYKNGNKRNGIDYIYIKYLYDIYISFCDLFNKIPSIYQFSYFVNIDYTLLYDIANNNYMDNDYKYASNNIIDNDSGMTASQTIKHLLQKANQNRENSLKDRAIDKGGAVGVAIVGNTEYSWNDPNKQIQATNNNNSINLPAFENSPQKALKGI